MVITWIILGFVTAELAKSQNRSFGTWLVYGFICFPVAIICLAISKPSDETLLSSGNYRKCPQCAEMVKIDAKICRYCGNELPEIVHEEKVIGDNDRSDDNLGILKILSIVIGGGVSIALFSFCLFVSMDMQNPLPIIGIALFYIIGPLYNEVEQLIKK